MGLLPWHDLQQAHLGNLAHLFALLLVKPSACLTGQFPRLERPGCVDEQIEGVEASFGHEPAHHLFRRYVDWIGFHCQLLLATGRLPGIDVGYVSRWPEHPQRLRRRRLRVLDLSWRQTLGKQGKHGMCDRLGVDARIPVHPLLNALDESTAAFRSLDVARGMPALERESTQ